MYPITESAQWPGRNRTDRRQSLLAGESKSFCFNLDCCSDEDYLGAEGLGGTDVWSQREYLLCRVQEFNLQTHLETFE